MAAKKQVTRVKKTPSRISKKAHKPPTPVALTENNSNVSTATNACCENKYCHCSFVSKFKIWYLLPVIVLLAALLYYFRSLFIVAIVNGVPVFRYNLNQRLTASFGTQTLENIIIEKLIQQEAGKKGIKVSPTDIQAEVDRLAANLGADTKIEDALKIQGVTLEDFKKQLKIQLEVNKLLENEVSVSAQEVDTFIKANGQALTATDEAGKKTEAESRLKEQKVGEKVQEWISGLLEKAQITRLLK